MPADVNINKVNSARLNSLKGKLLEIRRIGSKPVFIEVSKTTTIKTALGIADIETDEETKIEGILEGSDSWQVLTLNNKAIKFSKLAVTTKVSGA